MKRCIVYAKALACGRNDLHIRAMMPGLEPVWWRADTCMRMVPLSPTRDSGSINEAKACIVVYGALLTSVEISQATVVQVRAGV
jgi:hypothetical protein